MCRLWRNVVATNADLWSIIDSEWQPELYLKRSAKRNLTVYLNLRGGAGSPEEVSLVRTLAQHIEQIEELHWRFSSSSQAGHGESFHSYFTSPAPLLTSLSMEDDDWAELPLLFSGQSPRLKQLSLGRFRSWNSHQFPNLTHLFLFSQIGRAQSKTSEFLEYLSSCPNLEELRLVLAGPTLPIEWDVLPEVGFVPLCLPHLHSIELGDWPGWEFQIHRFLSYLDLPSMTSLVLWTYTGDLLKHYTGEFSILPPKLSPALTTIHEACIICMAEGTASANNPPTPTNVSLLALTHGVLYLYGMTPARTMAELSHLQLDKVHTLSIRDDMETLSHLRWTQFMSGLPSLERLRIAGWHAPAFSRALLTSLTPVVQPGLVQSIPNPKLKNIYLESGTGIELPIRELQTLAEGRSTYTPRPLTKLRVAVWATDGHLLTEEGITSQREEVIALQRWIRRVYFDAQLKMMFPMLPEFWPTRAFQWVHMR